MEIHRLTATDIDKLRALNALFADAFDDADSYLRAPPDEARSRRTLDKDHVIALVAVEGTAVVGGLVAYELDKLEQARSEVYIYDLAVAESHRRRGIASRLIAALQRIAAARDAHVIYVQADYGDDAAIGLYTKLGAREDVMHFDITVTPRERA